MASFSNIAALMGKLELALHQAAQAHAEIANALQAIDDLPALLPEQWARWDRQFHTRPDLLQARRTAATQPLIAFPHDRLSPRMQHVIDRFERLCGFSVSANLINECGPDMLEELRDCGDTTLAEIYKILRSLLTPASKWEKWANKYGRQLLSD